MPFVLAGDVSVHYDLTGAHDAPVVMLANSLGTNVHLWDDQVDVLARSHRVLRYDMRGHGLTELGPDGVVPDATVEGLAADAVALLDALEIECVRFVGLSIGGMIGQRVAAEYPARVDALVLCATGSRIGSEAIWNERIATVEREGVEAIVDATMGRWFTARARAEEPELVRGFATMLRRTPADGYVAGCRAVRDADLRADDARITCRTLVVAGAQDPVTTPSMGVELRDAIPGAEMLAVIDSAAHILCAEQPAATTTLLQRFLEGS